MEQDAVEFERVMTIRLPADLHDELRALAHAEDRSIAGILRLAARQFLAQRRAA